MKMFHKFINTEQMKRIVRNRGRVGTAGEGFFFKEMYLFTVLLIITIVIQCLVNNAEAKSEIQRSKKTLKVLQSSSSLIQLRHKRDTFANEHQEQKLPQHQTGEGFVRPHINYYENIGAEENDDDDDNDYYDDNYDVLPGNNQSPSITDQISDKAKQIAESITNMVQSLTNSIRQCMEGLRAVFTESFDYEDLTPEQQQQLRVAMEQQYQTKSEYDNEDFINKL